MSHIYAKFVNQYKFKYQLSLMALVNKFEEDGDIRKEAEMSINLNMANNLTQSEIDNELNIERFDFTNGFRCSDMYRFEK